ncbi:RNA-directed DNA polymerase from mobile element jockey [Trichonephila clavipes]|nr:RNA-directed DNA polymerase from mobile element jockey [Trichonephila clavipes]
MSWLLYQLVYNPACLVTPGGAWMGSCIAERGALPMPLLVAESRASPAKLVLCNSKGILLPLSQKKFKISQNIDTTQNASIKTPNPLNPTHDAQPMASLNPSPGKGLMLPNLDVDKLSLHTRFLIISLTNNEMSKVSPFAIQKALIGIGGEPKSVKRLRSGDLLVETNSALQTKSFLLAKHFLNSPFTISPHKTLNSCRGIISETDLLGTPDGEILEGFSSQGVIQCQRFGHSQTSCRGQLTCSRCASVGHASTECNVQPKCVNCLQPHPSDSKICPKWKIEKQIQEIKTTKNISYPEARKLIVPQLSQTYAQAAKSSTFNNSIQTDENITKIKCPPLKLLAPLSSKQRTHIPTAVTTSSSAQTELLPSSKTSTTSDPQPPTPISKTKGKIKEQPSPLHRPRKDNIKIDLMRIKPPSNLKKNPEKNTSVKIAREQDSPNETSPVSKKSRRRKTFKISDAMETDANPSDTDYVTDDVKDIIRQYHPVCVALQETFLKSCHTTKIRRYGCVRKDTEGPSVSGGVCIFTSLDVPSSALPLHTSLQAVAVRIHSTSLITACCLYLPPNTVIHQHDLNNLVDQLPAPFIILGDFNGHSTLWGSAKTNPRGRQIEQVLSDHCLCLLNHGEPTYFHEPTRSFHTIDLAICSPSLLPHLNLSVEKDLYNSDHFPVILSHDSDPGGKTFPPTYSYRQVTNVLIAAADLSIPKVSSHSFQRYKPWWNADCQTAYKNQRRLWGIFRRYPTTENLLAFKKAKANARRVRRRSQRQSWIRYVSSLTSSTSSKQLWKKVKAANGIYREFSFSILQTSNSVFSSPEEIANILGETFQSVSSAASYNSRFLEIKRRAERTPINFLTRSFFPYNCYFTMTELKKALIQAHNTSPGPDGITYTMLRHLHPNSLANILFLFNRVWKEHCFPSSWREAIVIPILKPGKVATDPLSYRPIALMSCFCKTFERMVNTRLVYVLEKEKCVFLLYRVDSARADPLLLTLFF